MHKTLILSLTLALSVKSGFANISIKGIYGIDNRKDFYEESDPMLLSASNGVAAMIFNSSLTKQENGEYFYNYPKFGEVGIEKLCSNERYLNQQAGAFCSGFLIAPDILVTAGHCVKSSIECSDSFWIFDYKQNTSEVSDFRFKDSQMVRCKELIAQSFNKDEILDYAILRLEREVNDRTILKFNTSSKISNDAILAVIGHPSGLPQKITTNAVIRDNSQAAQFIINSDSFHGNSGSPVINSVTGLVEGILVRGGADYSSDLKKKCRKIVKINENEGRGEDVIRASEIINILKKGPN